jgi:hypothetical protein
MTMPNTTKEQEYREEAERLAHQLKEALAVHRIIADDLRLSATTRRYAKNVADALENPPGIFGCQEHAMSTTTRDDRQEHAEEAQQFSQLPLADQKEIIAAYRECANNPKIPEREREWGQARVAALEHHLRRPNRQK